MCSMIDSGEKGYKLPEQILFNSLVLYLTLLITISLSQRPTDRGLWNKMLMLRFMAINFIDNCQNRICQRYTYIYILHCK